MKVNILQRLHFRKKVSEFVISQLEPCSLTSLAKSLNVNRQTIVNTVNDAGAALEGVSKKPGRPASQRKAVIENIQQHLPEMSAKCAAKILRDSADMLERMDEGFFMSNRPN